MFFRVGTFWLGLALFGVVLGASVLGAVLGLAIAQGLVQAHGGRTTVANADQGCRFTMHLPRSASVER